MLLGSFYQGIEIHRKARTIYARFLVPHVVLSTCRAAGGLQTGLDLLLNHQSCEPAGHRSGLASRACNDPQAYRRLVCEQAGLGDESCAILGTAANMHNASIQERNFGQLTVVAVCTAGVETNAGRAGDPAAVVETDQGFEKLAAQEQLPAAGTINIMLFVNRPLTPGALVRTVVTATEAKTAALQELAVNSRYSDGPATGTGTDQIGVAAVKEGPYRLTSAGKHVKLGELIGRSVLAAVKEALALQNGLTPQAQCSARIHLERFGCNRQQMLATICGFLAKNQAELLAANFAAIERDPVTVAAVAAAAHLRDKFAWQILPLACWSEIMGAYAAQVACAVSGKYGMMKDFRRQLAPLQSNNDNRAFVELICRAIALGFDAKWKPKEVVRNPE